MLKLNDPSSPLLQIAANRKAQKYTRKELFARSVWAVSIPLFRWSPRLLFGWRSWLLRRFGAEVGRHVHIYPSVRIEYPWLLSIGDDSALGEDVRVYNLGPIRIGSCATISQNSHLCAGTHDHCSPDMQLIKAPIHIENDVWICADAFIGPGITIGQGAVVGARAAVFKDVDPWTIVGGNPATRIGTRAIRHDKDAISD